MHTMVSKDIMPEDAARWWVARKVYSKALNILLYNSQIMQVHFYNIVISFIIIDSSHLFPVFHFCFKFSIHFSILFFVVWLFYRSSPEVNKNGLYSSSSDVFSFGILCFELYWAFDAKKGSTPEDIKPFSHLDDNQVTLRLVTSCLVTSCLVTSCSVTSRRFPKIKEPIVLKFAGNYSLWSAKLSCQLFSLGLLN